MKAVAPLAGHGEEQIQLRGRDNGNRSHALVIASSKAMKQSIRSFIVCASFGSISDHESFLDSCMACDLILVLDAQSPRDVAPTLRQLQSTVRWVKVGLEMFAACGPDAVREIAGLGFK